MVWISSDPLIAEIGSINYVLPAYVFSKNSLIKKKKTQLIYIGLSWMGHAPLLVLRLGALGFFFLLIFFIIYFLNSSFNSMLILY